MRFFRAMFIGGVQRIGTSACGRHATFGGQQITV